MSGCKVEFLGKKKGSRQLLKKAAPTVSGWEAVEQVS